MYPVGPRIVNQSQCRSCIQILTLDFNLSPSKEQIKSFYLFNPTKPLPSLPVTNPLPFEHNPPKYDEAVSGNHPTVQNRQI